MDYLLCRDGSSYPTRFALPTLEQRRSTLDPISSIHSVTNLSGQTRLM
jgi:hypothetical protein